MSWAQWRSWPCSPMRPQSLCPTSSTAHATSFIWMPKQSGELAQPSLKKLSPSWMKVSQQMYTKNNQLNEILFMFLQLESYVKIWADDYLSRVFWLCVFCVPISWQKMLYHKLYIALYIYVGALFMSVLSGMWAWSSCIVLKGDPCRHETSDRSFYI